MAIAEVGRRYSQERDALAAVAERVRDVLQTFCSEHGYPFVGRSKSVESLTEKIESGRYQQWSDLDDLYACTVVIPTLREEPGVLGFLRSCFAEVTTKARGSTEKSPELFRFEATRFIARLKPPPGVDSAEPVYSSKFEVQVRTAFEHAWSAATHALVYKSGSVDWKRLRMAAQIKAAVEQLDTLVLAFDSSAELVTEHRYAGVAVRVAVVERLKPYVDRGIVPLEQGPKDWSRFSENFVELVRAGKRSRQRELADHTASALSVVCAELDKVHESYPRSISLQQFSLGALAEADWLKLPLERFAAVVTQELTDFFPRCGNVGPIFAFER